VLERLFPGAAHLQNIHPLVVHFPIAFLFGATLLYFLGAGLRSESIAGAGLWALVLGAIGAVLSAGTGLYANEGVMIAPSVREALLFHHRNLMIAVTVLTGGLTVWALAARPLPRRGRWAFLIGLIAVCVLIARGADYGGRLVYDYNAGGNACGQPIDFSK
jgi:uncharacterized membrane protein